MMFWYKRTKTNAVDIFYYEICMCQIVRKLSLKNASKPSPLNEWNRPGNGTGVILGLGSQAATGCSSFWDQ